MGCSKGLEYLEGKDFTSEGKDSVKKFVFFFYVARIIPAYIFMVLS